MNKISNLPRIFAGLFVCLTFIMSWSACNTSDQKVSESVMEKGIKDPNNPKPMAQMMRLLASQADSIKAYIARGEQLDSSQFYLPRYEQAEPTDSSVLTADFFQHASNFEKAYAELFRYPADYAANFNQLVSQCISCHQQFCPGPIKRIKKMKI